MSEQSILERLNAYDPSLTEIVLLKPTKETLYAVLKALSCNPNAVARMCLRLSYCTAFTKIGEQLSRYLARTRTLVSLTFTYKSTKFIDIHYAVAKALETNSSIRELAVVNEDCDVPMAGDFAFVKALNKMKRPADSMWKLSRNAAENEYLILNERAAATRDMTTHNFTLSLTPPTRKLIDSIVASDPSTTVIELTSKTTPVDDHIEILRALSATLNHTEDLTLMYGPGVKVPYELACALMKYIETTRTLTTLAVVAEVLDTNIYCAIARAFEKNRSVAKLILMTKRTTGAGSIYDMFTDALRVNSHRPANSRWVMQIGLFRADNCYEEVRERAATQQ